MKGAVAPEDQKYQKTRLDPGSVADWHIRLVESLPEKLRDSLPTIAELEAELTRSGGKSTKRAGGKSRERRPVS
jgi:hypothetical protein